MLYSANGTAISAFLLLSCSAAPNTLNSFVEIFDVQTCNQQRLRRRIAKPRLHQLGQKKAAILESCQGIHSAP
jgi:hypothetical protein